MNYWLRLYTGILDDPKVHRLPPEVFKGWVMLLCLAKEHDGVLPDLFDIAFRLRISETEAKKLIDTLKRSGFLDEDGETLKPHNWDKRQYKSDVSTERVKRYRNGERNVSETPPETEYRAETEPESEQSRGVTSRAKPRSASRKPKMCDDEFLAELQANPAYAVFDVKIIYHKMAEWCRRKGKQPTQGRLLGWLNREDRPMSAPPQKKLSEPGANKPAGYTLEDAARLEQTFDWPDWIETCIASGWRGQLEAERKLIAERGGPKEPWEHRVFEFLNNAAEAA